VSTREDRKKSRGEGSQKARPFNLLLPELLDTNLEVYVALVGGKKNEIVIEALTQFLKQKGIQPDKRPTKVIY
jgi:hypothetical protein